MSTADEPSWTTPSVASSTPPVPLAPAVVQSPHVDAVATPPQEGDDIQPVANVKGRKAAKGKALANAQIAAGSDATFEVREIGGCEIGGAADHFRHHRHQAEQSVAIDGEREARA